MQSLVCSLMPPPNYGRAPLIRPDQAEIRLKMFMQNRRECYPGSSAVCGRTPGTRVTLASAITIHFNTGLHPNITCYGVVAGANIVTTCTIPATRQLITFELTSTNVFHVSHCSALHP